MITAELGNPSLILGAKIFFVVVESRPDSVTVNVITDGGGDIAGNAETLSKVVFSPRMGLYVVFDSPEGTMPPRMAVMEVLKV
jgi:hypothetical protein